VVKLVFALRQLRISRDRSSSATGASSMRAEKHRAGIRRYVQLHTVETPVNEGLRLSRQAPEAFDGIAELWFDSLELPATPEAAAAGQALLEDERRFIDHARSPIWFGEERPILDL
jgi:hypothetical protein